MSFPGGGRPSAPRTVQHIDRRELYTSLPARVRYLHSFLDFNADDAAALEQGGKYIKALIPAVVNIVYKKLLTYDITARALTTRSTSYEGPIDLNPTLTSPQIEHRKQFLRGYLIKLCTDPTKMEFWEYMDKVGMMHVGQGRKHPLHIEYIHMGALLGFVQDVMFEAILSHPRLPLQIKTRVIKAIGKVLWIQNDLFAKWYVRDGEEFLNDTASDDEELEPEGMLHGKKIINTSDDDDTDATLTTSPGELQFEGLGISVVGDVKEGKTPSPVIGNGKEGTRIPRAMKRERSEDAPAGMGGCPFSGIASVMEAPHPLPPNANLKDGAKVEAK